MCKESLTTESTSFSSSSSAVEDGSKKIPSGFERHRGLVEIGLVLMSVIYGTVYYINPDISVSPTLCSEDVLKEGDGSCRRSDLIAYKVVSLLSMITMGSIGVYNWHFTKKLKRLGSKESSPEDRLFGNLAASNYLNVVIFCYQLWDFVVSLTIPEHFDAIFLVHHLLALLTAFCSLEYQMVSYYSVFYGGCSEFSSIFLIFVDGHDLIPITPGSLADQWIQLCQVMFFVTFSYYRIYGWISYSFPLWRDCQAVIESGSIEKHRPGKGYFLRLFQGLDFTLGVLQCFWYYTLVNMVLAIVSG
jgi:hypothetical protein